MTEQQTIDKLNQQIRCVSHEVRNHLSICDMYSRIIRKNLEKSGIENKSIDNAIDCIQKSIQVIGASILDLKSLNESALQVIDFKALLESGIDMARAYVVDKNIEFNVFIKNSDYIYVDENRLLACVVNIIKNGIEAIVNEGVIEIIAEIKDDFAILKISNNGKPIPKEKQSEIFKQGYTTKNTGCGLGLSICKKYLESFSAELTLLRSTKEKTTFEIKLPVYKTNK